MEQLTLDIIGFNNESLTDRQTDQPQTLAEKVEKSKQALRLAADMSRTYYGEPLIVTYSGGKDSDVMLHLAESCLSPDAFEVLNSHTSVDAPETVYHIREVFKRLNAKGIKTTIKYPKDKDGNHETMWTLIPKKKMPPTRLQRYCCSVLKETSTPNRLAALGVRKAESAGRQGRDIFGTRGGYARSGYLFFA
jgi:phosphoadenosine phosphosulfate reductase